RADIGAFAATDAQLRERRLVAEQLELGDPHRARRALHGTALARELVERYAVALQRRIHRRHLVDGATEALEHDGHLGCAGVYRAHLQHLALGVAGSSALAELQ